MIWFRLYFPDEKADEAQKVLGLVKRKFKPNFLQEYFAAMISLEKRDFSQALDDLRRAETIAKNADPTRLNHILYFQMGTAAERAGKFKEAEKYFRQSIEKKTRLRNGAELPRLYVGRSR